LMNAVADSSRTIKVALFTFKPEKMADEDAMKALEESRVKLMIGKFHLLSQTQIAVKESEKLTDWNVTLEGRLNDLKLEMEKREDLHAKAREELAVVTKDRNAVDNKLERAEKVEQRMLSVEAELDRSKQEIKEKDAIIVKLVKSAKDIDPAQEVLQRVEMALKESNELQVQLEEREELHTKAREELELISKEKSVLEERLVKTEKANAAVEQRLLSVEGELKLSGIAIQEKDAIICETFNEITSLKDTLVMKDEAEVGYKEKYNALVSQVEPFREQLDMYEEERAALETQNKAKDSDLKSLAKQYGQALGHQNHKQKIKHLVRLKEENVELKYVFSTFVYVFYVAAMLRSNVTDLGWQLWRPSCPRPSASSRCRTRRRCSPDPTTKCRRGQKAFRRRRWPAETAF
jgi:chromosome segregation ATPase